MCVRVCVLITIIFMCAVGGRCHAASGSRGSAVAWSSSDRVQAQSETVHAAYNTLTHVPTIIIVIRN